MSNMRIAFLESPGTHFTGPREYRDRVEKALSERHELGFFHGPPGPGWDLLHVLDVKRAPLSALGKAGVPVVVDVHDHYWAEFAVFPTPDLPARWILQKLRKRRYTRAFSMADAVIAHAKVVAGYIDHKNLHVVPYGLDFSSLDLKEGAERGPVLLMVGRDCLRKGLPVMARALEKITERFPAMRLTVIGDEYWHTKLWSRIISAGLPVEFLPGMPFNELVKWYHKSSVLVLPSYIETFPLAVLDAMAAGLPVVASAVGGIPEQIESGRNGILVRPGDAEELAQKVIMVLEDDYLRKRLVRGARESLEGRFDMDLLAQGLEGVYRSVLKR